MKSGRARRRAEELVAAAAFCVWIVFVTRVTADWALWKTLLAMTLAYAPFPFLIHWYSRRDPSARDSAPPPR
ncbi:MAG: hypothetical protein KF776_19935 [Burkholderiales bacterium]|nr:hypothetical protein [Burkholderiales bacterium]